MTECENDLNWLSLEQKNSSEMRLIGSVYQSSVKNQSFFVIFLKLSVANVLIFAIFGTFPRLHKLSTIE